MPDLRRCRWCRTPVTKPGQQTTRLRAAHCENRQCDWCRPCFERRTAAIEAGTTQTMTVRNPWPGQQAEGSSAASLRIDSRACAVSWLNASSAGAGGCGRDVSGSTM